jgi:hypothetical protein
MASPLPVQRGVLAGLTSGVVVEERDEERGRHRGFALQAKLRVRIATNSTDTLY